MSESAPKLYPVYFYHVVELCEAIDILQPFAARRAAAGISSKLDLWLKQFITRLNVLVSVMMHTDKNGVVMLRKDDRELIRHLSTWLKSEKCRPPQNLTQLIERKEPNP